MTNPLRLSAPRRLMIPAVTAALRDLARERGMELDDAHLLEFGRSLRAALENDEDHLREWTLRISRYLP
jgi:hypothetical protein